MFLQWCQVFGLIPAFFHVFGGFGAHWLQDLAGSIVNRAIVPAILATFVIPIVAQLALNRGSWILVCQLWANRGQSLVQLLKSVDRVFESSILGLFLGACGRHLLSCIVFWLTTTLLGSKVFGIPAVFSLFNALYTLPDLDPSPGLNGFALEAKLFVARVLHSLCFAL